MVQFQLAACADRDALGSVAAIEGCVYGLSVKNRQSSAICYLTVRHSRLLG